MKQPFYTNSVLTFSSWIRNSILLLWFSAASFPSVAQSLSADLASLDGIELTPNTIFNYRLHNPGNQTVPVEVTGRVQYRQSGLWFRYHFKLNLLPGTTILSKDQVYPEWEYSSYALKDLFQLYNKLPQGTYEYCVSVNDTRTGGAENPEPSDPVGCVYQTVEDMFLIHLVTPENDAKIYEYNPMLAWVVNYPFASELTYKLRVAELKQGQTPESAIVRNNPMYQDDHVMTTGTVYPVTARPLQKWQPYVWTVDAFYKGILLGGAEVWKFTIIDDSVLAPVAADQSYTHINIESGRGELFAVGMIKLKYTLEDAQHDVLSLRLMDNSGKEIKLKEKDLEAVYGDNRYIFQIKDNYNLKHLQKYRLEIKNKQQKTFIIYFKYANPDLI